MDCDRVVEDILRYFIEGFEREGFGFFRRPYDKLKEKLREDYFNAYRENWDFSKEDMEKMPRTGDFVSITASEVYGSLIERGEFDLSLKGRIIERLRGLGYSYLIDGKKR